MHELEASLLLIFQKKGKLELRSSALFLPVPHEVEAREQSKA
jgi:hypothetical protein